MRDDRLGLVFTCCHPALATGAQVALTLRLLGGLTTAEIARPFLVSEPTMAQQLIRAAINAVHSDAPTAAATHWWQIPQSYDQLPALAPSPVVGLNRAVAVAEVQGPEEALALVDDLAPGLDGHHVFHAIRADLLRRLGRDAEATREYEAAITRTENTAERAFLQLSRQALTRA